MEEPNPIYALQAAGGFASSLVHYGHVAPAHVFAPVRYLSKLTRYVGEVNNGGHGQYVENSKLADDDVEYCLAALTQIEAWDHLHRYQQMLRLCGRPDQVSNFLDGAFNATVEMSALDQGWFRLPDDEKLAGRVKSWLARQPGLHLVEDDQYAPVMLWLVERIAELARR